MVVLLDHVTWGLRPPGSSFFRWVLSYYNLTPLDLAPNSILNISNFVVYCEDYLQVEPNLSLFLETFYCNPQNRKNHTMGPYGGVAIQRRRSAVTYYQHLLLLQRHNTRPRDRQVPKLQAYTSRVERMYEQSSNRSQCTHGD